MPDWTDEVKEQVYTMYKDANPTPDTSTEIVKSIAEELGDDYTANGVRVILSKADLYIKKTPTTGSGSNGASKTPRVNKAEAINNLSELITAQGLEADMEIIGKLTGKAAIYFKEVFEKIAEED